MKMSNSVSEQRDHQRDHGTARCARDKGGGNAPVSTATWWRDHRSRRPKNIKKKKFGFSQKPPKIEKRKERVRDRGKRRRRRRKKEEKEEERKKRKKKKKKKKKKKRRGRKVKEESERERERERKRNLETRFVGRKTVSRETEEAKD
ncbi:hypothetical protein ACOSQ3_023693 [Xanthoceras sorbifolium]